MVIPVKVGYDVSTRAEAALRFRVRALAVITAR